MARNKRRGGVSSQLPDLLRQPSTFSEKCFRGKVRGRRMSEALAFLHPDESIFQGSKFQFPPDYVPRALSVHEKLWCQRKLILTPFPTPELLWQFPFENCGFYLFFFSLSFHAVFSSCQATYLFGFCLFSDVSLRSVIGFAGCEHHSNFEPWEKSTNQRVQDAYLRLYTARDTKRYLVWSAHHTYIPRANSIICSNKQTNHTS